MLGYFSEQEKPSLRETIFYFIYYGWIEMEIYINGGKNTFIFLKPNMAT